MGFGRFGLVFLFAFLLVSFTEAARNQITKVFDISKYGAVADGKTDISKAFSKVWSEACNWQGGQSSILVPSGTYRMGQIKLSGPCKGPIQLLIKGVLKAPTSYSSLNTDHWITLRYVDQLTMGGNGVLDGEGASAWRYNDCDVNSTCIRLPTSLRFDFVTNSSLEGITLLNSKNVHLNIFASQNVNIHNIRIQAPQHSPNTDGIHIGESSDIQIADSVIGAGDDCISLSPGTKNIDISKIVCGPGHGISVGSMGRTKDDDVRDIRVKNCTFNGTDNGLRIKTWAPSLPGNVFNLTMEDIVFNYVSNPILIEQQYCPSKNCDPKAASQIQINQVKFSNIKGTSKSKVAVNLQCSSKKPCQNIELRDINISYKGKGGPAISSCANVKGNSYGQQKPSSCLQSVKRGKV